MFDTNRFGPFVVSIFLRMLDFDQQPLESTEHFKNCKCCLMSLSLPELLFSMSQMCQLISFFLDAWLLSLFFLLFLVVAICFFFCNNDWDCANNGKDIGKYCHQPGIWSQIYIWAAYIVPISWAMYDIGLFIAYSCAIIFCYCVSWSL